MTYLVGQRLGRYEIEEEIGRGGMARVYRAVDTSLRRTVAIKVLAPQLAVDPEFAHRFEREAVLAANLRHPNIVGIYDVGEQDGMRYIAMEYVRGRSLYSIIEERGAIGLGYAVGVVEAVASALDYAHTQGAVHRDVKPQNIMIDVEGRVLLTDFGIAQPPEGDGRRERLTRTGVFMGTPEYISPEQASAERVDGRSDLYSLGIVTYEMITGKVPFSGSTLQIIVAHVQHAPPPPTSFAPDLPHEIDRVIGRILSKNPEQRFTSGAAFTSALRIVARKNLIPIANAAQLATLAVSPSSAGQETMLLGQTPNSMPMPPRMEPAPASSSEPTQVGESPLIEALPPQRRRPVPARPRIVEEEPLRPLVAPQPIAGSAGGGGRRIPWAVIIGGLLGGALLLLLIVVFRDTNATGPNPFQRTAVLVEPLFPTATLTPTPSATPTPTATLTPTVEPTATFTATPEPTQAPAPTSTPEPALPTFTPAPVLPTFTPIPDTDTPLPPTLEPTTPVTPTLGATAYPPPVEPTAPDAQTATQEAAVPSPTAIAATTATTVLTATSLTMTPVGATTLPTAAATTATTATVSVETATFAAETTTTTVTATVTLAPPTATTQAEGTALPQQAATLPSPSVEGKPAEPSTTMTITLEAVVEQKFSS
jgi:serine/threonine-protein kinase